MSKQDITNLLLLISLAIAIYQATIIWQTTTEINNTSKKINDIINKLNL